jgi:hypothetical protein
MRSYPLWAGIVLSSALALSCGKDASKGAPSPSGSASAGAEKGRWDPELSAKYARVDAKVAGEKGCLSCHQGIEVINAKMQPFFLSQVGNKNGFECAVCHEGKPDATTKEDAHAGMIPNPSSMWTNNEGKGCAKCHSGKDKLTTLMGKKKDYHPTGGAIMSITSTASDPSGKTGSDHVYRMERALMALETGKANKTLMSNGVIPKGEFKYSNFDMDDPDGKQPTVGSDAYLAWVKKALEDNYIGALDHVSRIPPLDEAAKMWGEAKAGFSDMHRKQCGRCHVWGEGRSKRGDHRAGGCAACHVLYTNDAKYEGGDPTIPKDRGPHMMKHEITTSIPTSQCTHCHTRGKRIGTTFAGLIEHTYVGSGKAGPWDEHGDPQNQIYTKEYNSTRPDLHAERGMQCADCHSSIDVHGDGNIYPVTFYQVEIACQDCHGTPTKLPWELPVGYGTPVTLEGERGVLANGGKEYLITSRGNARARWVKEGDTAHLINVSDGKKRPIPLLKSIATSNSWKTNQGRVAMGTISQHLDKLECYTCHSTAAPQCYGCHIKYDAKKPGTDWPLSAELQKQGKQVNTTTPGDIAVENVGYIRWEDPILAVNFKGRVAPAVPGCQTIWSFVNKDGKLIENNKVYTTSTGHPAPTLAPLQPHGNTLVARSCESCHTNPKAIGYGTNKTRSSAQLEGDLPHFANQGPPVIFDIPTSKHAKPQIPGLPDFPYAWDMLVTRSGKQVQNMPLLKDRPLDEKQRALVEREGLCVACHQHYNTKTWDNVRKNLRAQLKVEGRALTPAEHDQAVEKALLSLAGK